MIFERRVLAACLAVVVGVGVSEGVSSVVLGSRSTESSIWQ